MALGRYLQLLHNYLRMQLALRRGEPPIYWPLLTSFYLSHRCNLACSYCDDARGNKYPDLPPGEELSTEAVVAVLRKMRVVNNFINFTGGEPTVRKDFAAIVQAAKAMGFITHTNTNATYWHHLEPALPYLDVVSVSLDSLDCARSDATFGGVPGYTRKVLRTLADLRAEVERRRGELSVVVNSVILPGRIAEIYPVIDYCWENGFGFAPLPHLDACYPDRDLPGNLEYRRLMDHLIDLKRRGYPVESTVECLEGLRDFRKFDCVPMMIARIEPSGELYFPCGQLHTHGASLVGEEATFRGAVAEGLARHGYQPPHCDNRCHLSSYMDFSYILHSPSILLRDGMYRARGEWRRAVARWRGGAAFPVVSAAHHRAADLS